MKLAAYSFLLSLLLLSNPPGPTPMLKDFIHDAMDRKLSNTEIENKYFCNSQLHRTDYDGEVVRKEVDFWLSQQRDELRAKRLNLDEVAIVAYDSLPAGERPAKPFHMMSETTHTYVARYHGEIIWFFLLQEDKIASTVLLGMGDEHIFLDFCK